MIAKFGYSNIPDNASTSDSEYPNIKLLRREGSFIYLRFDNLSILNYLSTIAIVTW